MISRFTAPEDLPSTLRGAALAIGNFDGVHRGHQAVLAAAKQASARDGTAALVLTFEPHPRSVFKPEDPPARITPAPMKAEIFKALGFDGIVEMPFTQTFASYSADEFVDRILVAGFAVRHVVTGFNFHFGKNRQGGPAFLMEAGRSRHFDVVLVDALRQADAEVISSSRIRQALVSGDLAAANTSLGYRYRVSAPVLHGEKLGRKLGYPTANMALETETPLAYGVYAVRYIRPNGAVHNGVASFGRRPTVTDDGPPLLETFLFDFDGDLYGETATVCLCAHLRGEEKFDTIEALTVQMKHDELQARAILTALEPLSPLDAKLTFGA